MSTVNQASLRDEFARLKSKFGALYSAGKVPSETAMLVNALLMLLELMVAIFLEKNIREDSKNSSLPPSQTGEDERAISTRGSKSKASGGQDQRIAKSRTIESTRICSGLSSTDSA